MNPKENALSGASQLIVAEGLYNRIQSYFELIKAEINHRRFYRPDISWYVPGFPVALRYCQGKR